VDPVVKALVDKHGVSVGLDVAASIAGFSEDKFESFDAPDGSRGIERAAR
jgi:hypothetical protein